MVAFKRCIYVHPFHEEDPIGLVEAHRRRQRGVRVRLPAPGGHVRPGHFVDQLEGLSEDDKAKVMGGNLGRIMKVKAAA